MGNACCGNKLINKNKSVGQTASGNTGKMVTPPILEENSSGKQDNQVRSTANHEVITKQRFGNSSRKIENIASKVSDFKHELSEIFENLASISYHYGSLSKDSKNAIRDNLFSLLDEEISKIKISHPALKLHINDASLE